MPAYPPTFVMAYVSLKNLKGVCDWGVVDGGIGTEVLVRVGYYHTRFEIF